MPFPTTPDAWLHELKHYKSCNDWMSDLTDPYGKAIATFQAFTCSVIDGIERKDPEVTHMIEAGTLRDICSCLPSFQSTILKPWIKDAMLKHPFRRTAKQYHFLAIVQVQTRGDLRSPQNIAVGAKIELDGRKTRVYDPTSLVKDPDALYFFRSKNGIKEIDLSQNHANCTRECLICDNLFDEDMHLTQRAPCGHVVCSDCFGKWLKQCNATYACMMCRACVLCGNNYCPHHDVHQDRATPHSVPQIVDLVLPNKVDQVLHGIKPKRYWVLQESTRRDRAMLAWIEEILEVSGFGPQHPIRVR
jgi:hypothetical protein